MYLVVKDTHTGSYVPLSLDSPAFKNQSALSRYQPVPGSGPCPTLDAALHEADRIGRYQLPFLELVNTVLHRTSSLSEVESLLSDFASDDNVAEVDRDLSGAVDDAFAERDAPELVRTHQVDGVEFRSYIKERLNIPHEVERDPVAHALWERRQKSVFLPSQAVENVDRFIRASESPEQQQIRRLWANNEALLGDAGHVRGVDQTPEIAPHTSSLNQEAVRTNEDLIIAADQRLDKELGHPNRWRAVISEQAVALDNLAASTSGSLTVRVSTATKSDLALGMAALEAQSLGIPVKLDLLNVHADDLAAAGTQGASYDYMRSLLIANASSVHKMQNAGDVDVLRARLNNKRRDAKRILTHREAKGDLGYKPKRGSELVNWGSAEEALARGKQFPFQAGRANGDMLFDARSSGSSKKPLPPVTEHARLGGVPNPIEPPSIGAPKKEVTELLARLGSTPSAAPALPSVVQPPQHLQSSKPPAHGLTEGLRGAVNDQNLPVGLDSSNKHVADLLAAPENHAPLSAPLPQSSPLGGVSHPVGRDALPGVQTPRSSDAERRALASDLASGADDLHGSAPSPARVSSMVGRTFKLSAPLPRRTELVDSGQTPRGAIASSSTVCPRCMGNPLKFAVYAKGGNDGKCFQCGGAGRIEQTRVSKGRNFTLGDTPRSSAGLPGDPQDEVQRARDLLKRAEAADDFQDPASSLRALLASINNTDEDKLKVGLQNTRESAQGYDWARAIERDGDSGSFDRRMRARVGYRQAEHAEAAGLKHNVLRKLPEDIQTAYNDRVAEQVHRRELTHQTPMPAAFEPRQAGTGRSRYHFRTSHDFESIIKYDSEALSRTTGSGLPTLGASQMHALKGAALCPVCSGTGIERRYDDFKAGAGVVGKGRPLVCGSCSGSGAKGGLNKKGFRENIGRSVVDSEDGHIRTATAKTPREVIDDIKPGQLPGGGRRSLMGGAVSLNSARQLGTFNRLASTGLNYIPGSGSATTKLGALALGFAAQGLLTSAWNPALSGEQRAQIAAEGVVSRVGSMGLGTPKSTSRVAAEDRATEYANVMSGVVGLGVGAAAGAVVRDGLQRPITGRRSPVMQSLLNGVNDTHGVHAGRVAGTLATIAAAVAVAAVSQPLLESHMLQGLLANEGRRQGQGSRTVNLADEGRFAKNSSVDGVANAPEDLVVDISFQDEYGQELEVGALDQPSYDIQIDGDSSEEFEEVQ